MCRTPVGVRRTPDLIATASRQLTGIEIYYSAEIGPGIKIIHGTGTVIGVLYQQAVPVFADLAAGTYNLDSADVERRIIGNQHIILVNVILEIKRPAPLRPCAVYI